MLVDLHTHTTFSDGRLTPPGLVERAALRGLAALAVTDHDTTSGFALASEAARRRGIGIVTGVELSADVEGREVHLLGYGFDPGDARLRRYLAEFREERIWRAQETVRQLNALGAPVSWERVLAIASGGVLARPHIGQAIVEAGHAATITESFERYIGDGKPAYVPKPPIGPDRIIELLHGAGGVCVLAHPGAWFSEPDVAELTRLGLDGIETVHPSHDEDMQRHWSAVASRLELFTTGGSDFHGYRPGEDERLGATGVTVDSLGWLERCRVGLLHAPPWGPS